MRLSAFAWLLLSLLHAAPSYARGGGGCFLAGVPVLLADGSSVAIQLVRPGMSVRAFTENGELAQAIVREIVRVQAPGYFELSTMDGQVARVTAEHPFYVGEGRYRTAEELRRGDLVGASGKTAVDFKVLDGVSFHAGETEAFNLKTDYPHTFFAGGFAVHNKGGGGGGGGHGGGGAHGFYFHGTRYSSCTQVMDPVGQAQCRSQSRNGIWFAAVWLSLFGWIMRKKIVAVRSAQLDVVLPESKFKSKADETEALLSQLSGTDRKFDLQSLIARASGAFLTLQKCWEARDYAAMSPLVFDSLRESHRQQIDLMTRGHEINRIEGLKIQAVRFVKLRVDPEAGLEEVTALIQAIAQDYYVDDRTLKRLRGDSHPEVFQELWVFQWHGGAWLLREIDQMAESHAIREPNRVPGEAAGTFARPAPEDGKIARLVHELGARDGIWNETKMKDQARADSIAAFLCIEQRSTELISERSTPKMLSETQAEIDGLIARQEVTEFRNLCARKVDLIMARAASSGAPDSFTARVSMHAQRRVLKSGVVSLQDPDVKAFDILLGYLRHGDAFRLDHCGKSDR